jgi:CheY-like chemotaxis protein
VITADSGQEALEKLRRNRANVLIAALGMPTMDGFAFIAQVRRSEDVGIREIPAAALTAFARSEDRVRALQSGFEVHLSKPIDPALIALPVAAVYPSVERIWFDGPSDTDTADEHRRIQAQPEH